jgi:hypothetical protein
MPLDSWVLKKSSGNYDTYHFARFAGRTLGGDAQFLLKTVSSGSGWKSQINRLDLKAETRV